MISAVFFYVFATITTLSALRVVTARNPVHAVLCLILAFVNAAGVFLLLGAEFLALSLIIVYVGAVAVLFLFVVMMLDIKFQEMREHLHANLLPSLLVAGILLVELVLVGINWAVIAPDASAVLPITTQVTNTHAIGRLLYTDYIYLFQVAGLILFVAMIGAIVLTLRHKPDARRQNIADQLKRSPKKSVRLVKVPTGGGA